MNIVFVCLLLEMGGIEHNLVLLTREFVKKGHHVTVISRGGPLESDIIREGGRTERIDFYGLKAFTSGRRLAETLGKLNPDVVHLFAARCCVTAWVARTFFNPWNGHRQPVFLSSVMGLQNAPDEFMVTTHLRNWFLTVGVDMTILTSPEIASYYRRLPVRSSRLCKQLVCGVVLLDRFSEEDISRLRGELGIKPGERVIVTIGALEPRKSHELFVRAAALVCRERRDVRFLIVGEGYLRGEIMELIRELGLEKKVELLGVRRDVPALLSLADICVKPGILDGFVGITVLEAQSVGTPVVAFEGEDVREAVIHEKTGLLVKRGDSGDLAVKLNDLLDDPEKSRRLGTQGKIMVQNKFDIRVVAEGLLNRYNQLLKGEYVHEK